MKRSLLQDLHALLRGGIWRLLFRDHCACGSIGYTGRTRGSASIGDEDSVRLGRPLTQRNRFYGLVKVFEAESTVTPNSKMSRRTAPDPTGFDPYFGLHRSVAFADDTNVAAQRHDINFGTTILLVFRDTAQPDSTPEPVSIEICSDKQRRVKNKGDRKRCVYAG